MKSFISWIFTLVNISDFIWVCALRLEISLTLTFNSANGYNRMILEQFFLFFHDYMNRKSIFLTNLKEVKD